MVSKNVTMGWQEEMLIVGFFQFWGGFTGASFTDPSKAKSSLPTVLWFYDLSLVLVLPCHKTIKNSLILAHGAAALVTSLRLPGSHSDWGVEKHNPCWTFIMRGVNWRIKPPSSSSFFSCFPVSRPFLPFSRPLSWDPLFCFLLFVWVAWKLWQLSSWEGFFFFFLRVWLRRLEGYEVSIWVVCFRVFIDR